MASAGRTKSSTARQVSDAIEWTEVLRRESVQYFMCQDGKLELNWIYRINVVIKREKCTAGLRFSLLRIRRHESTIVVRKTDPTS